MAREGLPCSVFLFLTLTSAAAFQQLHSIRDLRNIDFGGTVPKHSLVLLHWFANHIDIDNNDVIPLTFEPNQGDYGIHHYGNYERMLNALPRPGRVTYRYYTLGNVNPNNNLHSHVTLPSYVTHGNRNLIDYDGNRDRVIFRVRQDRSVETIDEVYITQHYGHVRGNSQYDPEYTYRVSTNLLRELREFSVEGYQRNSLRELRDQFGYHVDDNLLGYLGSNWGDFACLGLLLFIVISNRHSVDPLYKEPTSHRPSRAASSANQKSRNVAVCPTPVNQTLGAHMMLMEEGHGLQMKLEVTATENGRARIVWEDIPESLLNQDVMLALFKNDQDDSNILSFRVKDSASGSRETCFPLNPGLQVRLHQANVHFCGLWTTMDQEIHRGPEFKNPETQARIEGYDAWLQLFVEEGKSCVRLYIKDTFLDWKETFQHSWVGFYTSANKPTDEYETWKWQWATKFSPENHYRGYSMYVYRSTLAIAPGVQARFILRGKQHAIAHTAAW